MNEFLHPTAGGDAEGPLEALGAVELMEHAGILPGAGHRTGLRYS